MKYDCLVLEIYKLFCFRFAFQYDRVCLYFIFVFFFRSEAPPSLSARAKKNPKGAPSFAERDYRENPHPEARAGVFILFVFERFCTVSNVFVRFRMFSDVFARFRTLSDVFERSCALLVDLKHNGLRRF